MKKRILIYYGYMGGGGAERVLLDLLHNIDYERYEVSLALICPGGVLYDQIPPEVRKILLWPRYNVQYKLLCRLSLWLGWNGPMRRHLRRWLGRDNFDAEISFLEGMPVKLHAIHRPDDLRARHLTWVHCDLDTHRYTATGFRQGEELRCYQAVEAVVNVSRDTRDALLRRFPELDPSRAIVINNPVDTRKIQRMALEEPQPDKDPSRLTLAFCGRLTPQKKPERMIRLARRLMDDPEVPPFRVLMIGDGELRTEVEALRHDLGLDDVVEMPGYLVNPYPLLATADVLVSTSAYEGFALVLMEAGALGVPIVSTRTAGPTHIIGENNNYGLLTSHDDDSIYRAVRRLLLDPALRGKYGRLALARSKDYGLRPFMKQFYHLVNKGL